MDFRNLLLIMVCGLLSFSSVAQGDLPIEEVFKVVEEMPRFPGCEKVVGNKERTDCASQKMLEYIYTNLRYPAEARKNSIEGMVVVSFVIEKDGSISDINIVRSPDESLSNASISAVQNMNVDGIRWIPGKQRGKTVRVQYTLPVKFKLDGGSKPKKQNPINAVDDTAAPPPPPPMEDEVFVVVENLPRFPGCEKMTDKREREECSKELMLQFVYENLEYPKLAKDNAVEGMCVVTFIVDTDGSLKDIETVRDIGYDCGDAAVAVIEKMNKDGKKWSPGTQRGRKVKVLYTLPIRFRIDE